MADHTPGPITPQDLTATINCDVCGTQIMMMEIYIDSDDLTVCLACCDTHEGIRPCKNRIRKYLQ